MRRLAAVFGICLLFSGGFFPSLAEEPGTTVRYTDALKKLLIEQDTVASRELLRQVLKADSTHAPSWFQLSVTDTDGEGLQAAGNAYRLDSLNKWYGALYGQRLLEAGRFDRARALYTRLVRVDRDNPENYRLLSLLYQQAGMPFSAIDVLDSAEMRFGKHPLLGASKRQLLVMTGQREKALEEAREMVDALPYDVENRVILAELYAAAGEDSLAMAAYDDALGIDSTAIPTLASMADYYFKRRDMKNYLSVSKQLFLNDELPLSEKVRTFTQFSSDMRLYRDHFFQMGDLVAVLAMRYPYDKRVVEFYATHLIYSGEWEQALAYYKRHLQDDPPELEYYRAIIDIESYHKRLDSVYRYVERALVLFPEETDLYASRAHAQAYAGEHADAVVSYKRAIRYADTDSLRGTLWGFIGDTYNQMREEATTTSGQAKYRRKSFGAYDQALKLYYDNSLVLNNYAYFMGESSTDPRELDRAFAMAARAIELEGNNATYLDTYGWVLFRLGRLQEARRVMQQAISFDRDESPELFFHYGEILAALEEKFMAETYYRKALEKGYEPAHEVQRRIDTLKNTP